jgi:hypothetical protein
MLMHTPPASPHHAVFDRVAQPPGGGGGAASAHARSASGLSGGAERASSDGGEGDPGGGARAGGGGRARAPAAARSRLGDGYGGGLDMLPGFDPMLPPVAVPAAARRHRSGATRPRAPGAVLR